MTEGSATTYTSVLDLKFEKIHLDFLRILPDFWIILGFHGLLDFQGFHMDFHFDYWISTGFL